LLSWDHRSTASESADPDPDKHDPDVNRPRATLEQPEEAALNGVKHGSRSCRDSLLGTIATSLTRWPKHDAFCADWSITTTALELGGDLGMFETIKLAKGLRPFRRNDRFAAPHAKLGVIRVFNSAFRAVGQVIEIMIFSAEQTRVRPNCEVELIEVVRLASQTPIGHDAEKFPVFMEFPIKRENVGTCSLEVSTTETECRFGVVDISTSEMEGVRDFGRMTMIFRESGLHPQFGNKRRLVPWLRPVPRPKLR